MIRFVSLILGALLALAPGCRRTTSNDVVVYVSEDQVFSEPVLKAFEQETGIHVKAVYDTEENKSTGAMNRLIAEKDNPQADVYWANEPIRAEVLKQKGISTPYSSSAAAGIPAGFRDADGHWTGFSARARVLLVNKKANGRPKSIEDYNDKSWSGRTAIAHPLFGTTTAEMAALFLAWGPNKAQSWLDAMKLNGVRITQSNGDSADAVIAGDVEWALVDSDDAAVALKEKKPVEVVYPDQGENQIGCFIVPNAAILIKGAPHSANGKKLIDYLLSKETEKRLAAADCAQIPLHPGVETPADVPRLDKIKVMKVDYAGVASKMQEIQPILKAWAEKR